MKNYLVKIMHDHTPNKTYTFRSTNRLNVGELAICKTRLGFTYGIVMEITKSSYEETRKYSGVASKANAHMFRKLSPYDRATIVFKNIEDIASAMNEFTFTDTSAAMAFLYKEVGASYVNTYHEDGNVFVGVYEDAYDENNNWDGLVFSSSFCLG